MYIYTYIYILYTYIYIYVCVYTCVCVCVLYICVCMCGMFSLFTQYCDVLQRQAYMCVCTSAREREEKRGRKHARGSENRESVHECMCD